MFLGCSGRPWRRIAAATAVAAAVSGAPSTLHALATGGDALAAARAAGTLIPGRRTRPGAVAGAFAHVAVSSFWGTVLGACLPRRHPVAAGAAAGMAIAALDLGVIARRRYPAIAALPTIPQLADHAVFGAAVGLGLAPTGLGRSRRR